MKSLAAAKTRAHERGFALVTALVSIVVVGALIAGTFAASREEYRAGASAIQAARAMTSAEYGLFATQANWNMVWNTSMNRGDTAVRQVDNGDATATVRVTRLNDNLFLVASEAAAGTVPGADAQRRVATLLRLNIPSVRTLGALTARGQTRIGGAATVNGRDTLYPGWDCPAPAANTGVAGIATPSYSLLVSGGTCTNLACIQGFPLASQTPLAADTTTYFNYGDLAWNDLKGMATKIVSGTLTGVSPRYVAGTVCDVNNLENWGEPNKAVAPAVPSSCEDYYPVIYAPGNLTINGDRGQGIILVEGNLDVQGGFRFYGLVIVRGELKTTGTGGHFNGTVMAANVAVGGGLTSSNTVSGNAAFRYSSCALVTALRGSSRPIAIRDRAWVELF